MLVVCLLFVAGVLSADLNLVNTTLTLSGDQTYDNVILTNSSIVVLDFVSNFATSGYLKMTVNGDLFIDQNSIITARGAGRKSVLCGNGEGPSSLPQSGGRGGCSVRDSGGGGGHFGAGGHGTKDCGFGIFAPCQFPRMQEQNCGGGPQAGACNFSIVAYPGSPTASTACCWEQGCDSNSQTSTDYLAWTGLPTVAGVAFTHNVFDADGLGPAGGDKGCRDGYDGSGRSATEGWGGAGGGKIEIAVSGTATILGQINVDGERGCASGNDSGGGGAGGTLILRANSVTLGEDPRAYLTASGGLGGDSQPNSAGLFAECVGAQVGSGQCDDCGGGGGGGIIWLETNSINYDPVILNIGALTPRITTSGALGGICDGCKQESKGFDGLVVLKGDIANIVDAGLVLSGFLVAVEACDGVDNTFDGLIDEGLLNLTCDGYQTTIYSCRDGAPRDCPGSHGDACIGNEDCASGLCTGTCVGLNPGDSCLWNAYCVSDICSDSICQGSKDGPPGTACVINSQCMSESCVANVCQGQNDISPGLVCVVNSECISNNCTDGICQGINDGPVGSACVIDSQCLLPNCTNNICQGDRSGSPGDACVIDSSCAFESCVGGICQGDRSGSSGDACVIDSQCASNNCVSGTCQGQGLLGPGDSCRIDSDCLSNNCTDLICQGDSDVTPGMPCVIDSQCTLNNCTASVCQGDNTGEPGAGCVIDSQCRANCANGTCTKLDLGQACTGNSDCASNRCDNGFCIPEQGSEGNDCATDDQCVSPLECIDFTCRTPIGSGGVTTNTDLPKATTSGSASMAIGGILIIVSLFVF